MTDLVERLRERENVPTHDPRVVSTDALAVEAAAEIERLRSVATAEMKLREGNFAEIEQLRARVAELEAALDHYSGGASEALLRAVESQGDLDPDARRAYRDRVEILPVIAS